MQNRYASPLRYPGGKGALSDFIKALFESNNLCDGEYAEPYAGGAAVALSLLFGEYASRVHINDLDPAVFAFWHSVCHQTEALCRLIRDTPITMEEWKRQKLVYREQKTGDRLALGFAAFFLNRTNRSGVLRGGAIGGVEQTGKWCLDARFNKDDLIRRVQRIARYGSRIRVYNLDAVDFVQNALAGISRKTLVFLDPPYYEKGASRLYANYYNKSDHEGISSVVTSRISQHWIVSYDDAPQIRALYNGYRMVSYKLSYSASRRSVGSEIMVFSSMLTLPNVRMTPHTVCVPEN